MNVRSPAKPHLLQRLGRIISLVFSILLFPILLAIALLPMPGWAICLAPFSVLLVVMLNARRIALFLHNLDSFLTS